MEIVVILMLLPFSALCTAGTIHIYRREQRQRRRWLYEQSKDYKVQWQEFESKHKNDFESDYWNTTVNHPERLERGG